jgi:PAS domain S-box-containing protein
VNWHLAAGLSTLVAAATMGGSIALLVWQRRLLPGARAFALYMLAVTEWVLGYALMLAAPDQETQAFWGNVRNLGVVAAPTLWFIFVLAYTQHDRWLTRRRLALLAIPPILSITVIWTNAWHGLFSGGVVWDAEAPFPVLKATRIGPWFWVNLLYSYALVSISVWLLYGFYRRSQGGRRRQAGVFLVSALLPWLGSLLYVVGLRVAHLDPTPFSFFVAGAVVVWGMAHYQLLDITPLARDAVMESIDDAVVVLDAQGRIVDLNPAARRIAQASGRDPIGLAINSFLELEPGLAAWWEGDCAAQGEIVVGEGEGRRFYEVRSTPLRGRDHLVAGRVLVFHDITERRRIEEALGRDLAERRAVEETLRRRNRNLALLNQIGQELTASLDLRQINERLSHAVAMALDAEGGSIWLWDDEVPGGLICRSAFEEGADRSPVNLRLAPGEGIVGWVARTGTGVVVDRAEDDPRFSGEIDAQIGYRTRSLLAVPLRVRGSVIGVLEVVNKRNGSFTLEDRDLAETLAASTAIAIDNARLVEALRQQTDDLRARNEDLDAFAHTVAHDLKNPLAMIAGFADILRNGADLPAQDQEKYLHTIVRNVQRMNNIINELLLLAEVRTQAVEQERLEMGQIVDAAFQHLAYLIEEYDAEIVLPDSWPTAWGHAPWVEEVWVNYLSNALKYGGRPPRLELGAGIEANGMARFWVRDNGSGLTLEEQARLFTPFTRLDQARARGHGLGLSIVRRIVEKLGGEVAVESEGVPGRGCVFSFTLPMMPPAGG